MSNTLYTDAVNGFEDAWIEMYELHIADVAYNLDTAENTIVNCSEDELKGLFERKYDCKLTQQGKAHHYWYNFDSVQFNSDSAHTMFLLKWS